jgi:perosamine synthetase
MSWTTTEQEYAPTSTRTVPYANCYVCPEARAAALDVLASGWLTAGAQTFAFERDFSAWVGAPETIAVSSCTAAIELSLRAMRLPPGAPVLTPTITFCGAVHAIVHSGLRPVLIDADEDTLTVSAATVARAAQGVRPAAMVIQHMAGFPAPVGQLAEAAGLPLSRVVEDAAHGLGAAVDGQPVGTLSRATCFSFYATKNLPIGEGGAICTDDPELADQLREMRQHGMSKDAWRRYRPGAGWRYSVDSDGLKANFTDLQAAIGRAQLTQLSGWQRRRADIAARYDRALADVPGVILPPRPKNGTHAWHLYVVRIAAEYGRTRDELAERLTALDVGTSVHFVPVHHFSYFRRLLGAGAENLPVADRLSDQLLSLPLHPQLSDLDVDQVCTHITALCRRTGGL